MSDLAFDGAFEGALDPVPPAAMGDVADLPPRFRFTTIAHARHRYLSPIGEPRVAWLLDRLEAHGLPRGARTIDVGCGKAELLLRIADRFGGEAVGVDPSPSFLRRAAARAASLGLGAKATWRCEPASEHALVGGPFDLASSIGASHAFGTLEATVAQLARVLRPSGMLLVGDGHWRQPPAPEYLTLLGGSEEEMTSHAGMLAMLTACGLTILEEWTSSEAEWDTYEELYASTMRAHLASHPDDPDRAAFAERIERWSEGYRRWGRATLGFGFALCRVERTGRNAQSSLS